MAARYRFPAERNHLKIALGTQVVPRPLVRCYAIRPADVGNVTRGFRNRELRWGTGRGGLCLVIAFNLQVDRADEYIFVKAASFMS